MNLTLQTLLDEGTRALELSGIGEAGLDAKYLLFEAFHTDMVHFLMHRNEEVKDEDSVKGAVADYRRMIERRSQRIPLQQITGSREFMGLDFCVDEHVLIPRQDTETLVELVLKEFQGRDPALLDLCTGSGCIGLSLAVLGGFTDVTLADISREALNVAVKNARRLAAERLKPLEWRLDTLEERPWRLELKTGAQEDGGLNHAESARTISLVESDLFSAFSGAGRRTFDVIVSNPPYIPTAVVEELEPEVKDHEPRLALDGREDGLHFYKRIAEECREYLRPGGAVYLEIGYDQGEAVCGLLRSAGFERVKVYRDMPGLDRVVTGIMV